MKTQTILAAIGSTALLVALLDGSALGQDAAVARGDAKFQHSCAPCHGDGPGDDGRAMLPGTDALRIKYRGALPALIEQRSDLTPEVLRVYLRQGSMSMPPFRPTELTDDEIDDIAAYLAESSKQPDR